MTLYEIENKVRSLATAINANRGLLPTYGYSMDFAHPHIETDHRGLHYVIVERGNESSRKTTNDIDELLFWIFESITFSISTEFELKHRDESRDCRRIIFSKQEELLDKINPKWKQRALKKHQEVLKQNPFDDLAGLRVTYSGKLRTNGFSELEIKRLVLEKYPDPK
ncbi:MAG: Imm63 family immunity protein [Bacteroidota bacterium]